MAELAPYLDGMHEGQGFNTYLQTTAGLETVTITRGPSEKPGYTSQMTSQYIEEHYQLMQSKELSAGGTIKGWGNHLKVNSSYLNRYEFETADYTYEVHVSVRKQSGGSRNSYKFNWYDQKENVHLFYGDRFISGFITGGDLYARCSITTLSQYNKEETRRHAEVAFGIFKIGGEISQDAMNSLQTLSQTTQIKITAFVTGGGSPNQLDISGDLLKLREEALRYYNNADQQNFRIYAMLEPYFKTPNFKQEFTPLNYSFARIKSWPFCDEFTLWTYLEMLTGEIPEDAFLTTDKGKWMSECFNQQQILEDAVSKVSEDPEKLGEILHQPRRSPGVFLAELLSEVSTRYELRKILVDQTRQIDTREPITSTIAETAGIFADGVPVAPFASILGRFRAFSFPFPGSVLVSLAYLSPNNCHTSFQYGWHIVDYTSTTGFWHNRAVPHIHFPTTADNITEYIYFWALPTSLPGLLRRNSPLAIKRMDVRVEDKPTDILWTVKTSSLVIEMSPLSSSSTNGGPLGGEPTRGGSVHDSNAVIAQFYVNVLDEADRKSVV